MMNESKMNNFLIKDVSNLACFLSSDISSYITGQTINVDGGMVI